jgi:hypothetical protein
MVPPKASGNRGSRAVSRVACGLPLNDCCSLFVGVVKSETSLMPNELAFLSLLPESGARPWRHPPKSFPSFRR